MPQTPSLMSLHLSYRLWIAEMNFDITVLRIFDDSLRELETIKTESAVKEGIKHFEQVFAEIRKEMEEIENHVTVKKNYFDFRKRFDAIKKEYKQFENQWMQ
jgi:hypothetical protein